MGDTLKTLYIFLGVLCVISCQHKQRQPSSTSSFLIEDYSNHFSSSYPIQANENTSIDHLGEIKTLLESCYSSSDIKLLSITELTDQVKSFADKVDVFVSQILNKESKISFYTANIVFESHTSSRLIRVITHLKRDKNGYANTMQIASSFEDSTQKKCSK